ncbi:PAQR family membrane homeostasis protein TrhA [Proteocatella sphenisci]|uniref:PAQR family membrane homeostasis protein TrhA n=1 Tax=Proteocatella sphenisci TaxID=181070 RepID=UPI000490BC0C|nr:hemolysin III family protein [Proteocatella sphenisci]
MTNIKFRDPVSAISHYIGAALSIVAMTMVVFNQKENLSIDNINLISALIFTASMFMLYSASGIYHTLMLPKEKLVFFRKLDHSMIYVLIAGSYTPLCLAIKDINHGYKLLILIWSLAIAGIIIKLCFFNAPRVIGTAFYIILGWMIVFFIKDVVDVLALNGMILLGLGGISYTIGGLVYIVKKPNCKNLNFHDLFHFFVLAGTALQFITVYIYIL